MIGKKAHANIILEDRIVELSFEEFVSIIQNLRLHAALLPSFLVK